MAPPLSFEQSAGGGGVKPPFTAFSHIFRKRYAEEENIRKQINRNLSILINLYFEYHFHFFFSSAVYRFWNIYESGRKIDLCTPSRLQLLLFTSSLFLAALQSKILAYSMHSTKNSLTWLRDFQNVRLSKTNNKL